MARNLQDGIVKQTKRGEYCPDAHLKSNECGLVIANMFRNVFGGTILKCIVNPDMIGHEPQLVGDDGEFDIELTLPNNSSFFSTPVSHGGNHLFIEVEIKCLKTKFFKKEDIWPRHFPTADFGWLKYRDLHDPAKFRDYVLKAAKSPKTDLLHVLGLYYVDDDNRVLEPFKYAWFIHLKDLILKEKVSEKDNSRKEKEKFYVADVNNPWIVLLNLETGEVI